jgi:hypothetical protein
MELNLSKYQHCEFLESNSVLVTKEHSWKYVYFGEMDNSALQKKIFDHIGIKSNGSKIDPSTLGKMFFSKSASVPRYKVREIKDKYNLSVIRDSSKADTIVISKNEIKDNIGHDWRVYMYPRSFVKETLEALYISYDPKVSHHFADNAAKLLNDKEAIKSSIDALNALNPDIEYISFSYRCRNKFDIVSNALGLYNTFLNSGQIIDPDVYDVLSYSTGKQVVTDSALQSILGSSEMEHENYVFIDQLLSSSDPSNVELGLTLMANCNFEESQHYLLILLGDYFARHRYVNYCHSVAFKSLLDFMDFSYRTHVSLDDILNKADSVNKLTDEIKAIVHKRATSEFDRILSRYDWIVCKGIEIVKPQPQQKTEPQP